MTDSNKSPAEKDFDSNEWLRDLVGRTRDAYSQNRRVMSFGEYLKLFAAAPVQQSRCASALLLDVFAHFGTMVVTGPQGPAKRFNLFDCPWDEGRERLWGQEHVQAAVYRLIGNFAREGQSNRLVLLHGPNGSAKSTFINCLQRALEHYSIQDEGALYRFNWIFPTQKLVRGGIGFSGRGTAPADVGETFAHLDEDMIEGKFSDEFRDHPLLLLPTERRQALLTDVLAGADTHGFHPARILVSGELSPRNRMIYEALLASYHGDLGKVLRHVQVERYYVSRRYREGVATVGPQLAVDAHARQLTLGRDLTSLPPAIQALPLHEYHGELVNAHRGLVEFEDLLKRPLDAFKYLLTTVEDGLVSLDLATLQIDTVFIASSNEGYVAAFKEIPEFQSFKGRIEFVRSPYLTDYRVEERIYEEHLSNVLGGQDARHIAPHVAECAALWAVLTRMRKPNDDKYPKGLADLVGRLSPLDKALLYAGEDPVEPFTTEQRREILGARVKVARESDSYPNYEGRMGASPREMKMLLMHTAQSDHYRCVSPFALLDELENLVKNGVSVYEFLKQESAPGGYHDHRKFIFQVKDRLIDKIDDEVRASMGLVEEGRYLTQFTRYITHVSYWVKGEKVPNTVTGAQESPSEDLMAEVERELDVGTGNKREDFRRDVISRIGAWSVDNRGKKPALEAIFSREIGKLKAAYYNDNKKKVGKLNETLLVYLTGGDDNLDAAARAEAKNTVTRLKKDHGYCENCARDAIAVLMKKRYS